MADAHEELRPAVAWERQKREALKEQWDAWFRLRRMEAEGTMFHWFRIRGQQFFDIPVTWFKETIVNPLHDKYKLPYYQRQLSRVPTIDQCKVLDNKCFLEASTQHRLDRQVDGSIMMILMERMSSCMEYHNFAEGKSNEACIPLMEDYEEAELNFFIKYGELGDFADAKDCLMKQKHRMIWERRHPEIMAERERAFKEHKRDTVLGKFNSSFWKKGYPWDDKEGSWLPYEMAHGETPLDDKFPISKDWQYYRDVNKEGSAANEEEKNRQRFDPNLIRS